MEMLSSLILPAIIFIGMFVVACLGHQILSLVWSLLMSSYNLSLPGLLWGAQGTFSGMPTFIPSTASPIMHFYYWFMLFGILAILIAMLLNAFRHLAIWGKFDEQQNYKAEGFAKQFLWILGLVFMTFLTPIIIWAVYSVFMLGVLWLNQLAGSSLVLSISKEDYIALKAAMSSDLAAIQNLSLAELQTFLTSLASDAKVISYLRNTLHLDEQTVQQILWDLNNLTSRYSGETVQAFQAAVSNLKNAVDGCGFTNPITKDLLSKFQSAAASLRWETSKDYEKITDDVYIIKHSFYQAWNTIFANSKFTFIDLIKNSSNPSSDAAKKMIEMYNNSYTKAVSTNPFTIFGHNGYATPTNATSCAIDRLSQSAAYTKKMFGNLSTDISAYFLTFKNGGEVGLKTCPLELYLNAMVTGSTTQMDIASYLSGELVGMIGGAGMLLGGIGLANIEIPVPTVGFTHPLMPLGVIYCVFGVVLIIQFGIPLLIQLALWFGGFKLIIKPILGMVVFLWASFFEAAWYFLLLLPAIGTCIGENGTETYKQTWKTMFGKMSTILVMWGGLLLLVAAMGCINSFTDQIYNSFEKTTDGTISSIVIEFDMSSFIKGLLINGIGTIGITISIRAIIQFILAVVSMNLAFKFMQKVGTMAFGEGAYGDMQNYLQSPVSALAPGAAGLATATAGHLARAGSTMARGAMASGKAANKWSKNGGVDKMNAKSQAKLDAKAAKKDSKEAAKAQKQWDKAKSQAGKAGAIQAKLDKGGLSQKERNKLYKERNKLKEESAKNFEKAGSKEHRDALFVQAEASQKTATASRQEADNQILKYKAAKSRDKDITSKIQQALKENSYNSNNAKQ